MLGSGQNVRILAIVVVISANTPNNQESDTTTDANQNGPSHLKIIEGRIFCRSHSETGTLSVFSYPYPAPARIVPRSLSAPHDAPCGRASGMCVRSTVGFRNLSAA